MTPPRARRKTPAPPSRKGRSKGTKAPAPRRRFPIRALLLDVGDTLIDEGKPQTQDQVLPGVRETLPQLAEAYRLAALSNTAVATRADLHRVFQYLGIAEPFSAIVTSTDIGWRKPHPVMFNAGLAALGTTARETVMVGNDLQADVAGAKVRGLRTVHVAGSPRYRQEPRDELEVPTATIRSLTELPTTLRRLEGIRPPTPGIEVDSLEGTR